MRKYIPLSSIIIFAFCLQLGLTTFAQDAAPTPLTNEQKLSLYSLRDKVDPALAKLQPTAAYKEYNSALDEQKLATIALQSALDKVKATPEGKEYIDAADKYAAALQAVLKNVDQSKWKFGVGYAWVPVEQPKTEAPKEKK
jgi:hypothetical protein